MVKRLRVLMWDIIGVSILIVLVTAFVEWINHEASWDGLYAAHVKHMGLAIDQVGYNPFCSSLDNAQLLSLKEQHRQSVQTQKSMAMIKTEGPWVEKEF